MMLDLHNNVKIIQAIAPAAGQNGNAPVVSAVLDTVHFSTAEFVANFGAIGNGTFTLAFQDSADNATFTAVDPTQLFGATDLSALVANQTFKIGYKGINRYLRVTITPVGNSATFYLSAVWIQSHPSRPPVAAQLN